MRKFLAKEYFSYLSLARSLVDLDKDLCTPTLSVVICFPNEAPFPLNSWASGSAGSADKGMHFAY